MEEDRKKEILCIIREVGSEFSEIPDDSVSLRIGLAEPFIGKNCFGPLYNQAVAYFVCHKMKLDGLGDNSNGTINQTMNVTSYSEGSTSIGYSTNQSNNLQPDAEYTLTSYGLQFLSIRRSCVIPAIIASPLR